jgi:hypothetical protein
MIWRHELEHRRLAEKLNGTVILIIIEDQKFLYTLWE